MNQTNPNRGFKSLLEIFLVSTRLGLTSFGGPTAHLGYFHEEYVRRRKWMDEKGVYCSELLSYLSQFHNPEPLFPSNRYER